MAFGSNHSYTARRLVLYALLWCTAVVVLGLSAWRIHYTRSHLGFHERIVVELLVTSILTIIWVPIAMFLLMAVRAANTVSGAGRNSSRHPHWPHEQFGGWILWAMWLVGAAILTNKYPTKFYRGFGNQARLLATLIALSWVAWSLLTIIGVLAWMHHASTRGPASGSTYGRGGLVSGHGKNATGSHYDSDPMRLDAHHTGTV
ncbi:hypothetical protein EXIGLDRAFT_840307 [Exidia glandulosa HHB12029]|uniref:MARVEL domain-containing protein n=1 Tax=Exidia glandulosa HHB12029 TaxID=1314781 RepID=A0A165EIE1_EXIGL|nr:hypothetical protein EXIGLDRAFT_840307 [Exidia glandulosa HHB12029]